MAKHTEKCCQIPWVIKHEVILNDNDSPLPGDGGDELREDGGVKLREDGGIQEREN